MDPREVLNKLKWHPDFDLNRAKIEIVHRGESKGKLTILGENSSGLEGGFMKVERSGKQVRIPYHRVLKIETPKEVIWNKNR